MLKRYWCIFLLLFPLSAFAQKPTDTTIPVFFEIAYLHSDRDVYAQGEDIWFKAYVVNAQTNEPINYSHNLYVELISPSAKIVSRQMLRLENGLGNGDFKLADTLTAGNYRLRAYTNWMRNFGDNFIFEKTIRIINLLDKQPAIADTKGNKKTLAKPAKVAGLNPDTIPVVQFFPEGGAIIDGVSSVIAVKAEDINGRGVSATGKVMDDSGKAVGSFICDSLGFGALTLLPAATQHYQALVTINGQQRRFALPWVSSSGFNLTVIQQLNTITAAINCNNATFDQHSGGRLYLTAKHAGRTYLREVVVVTGKSTAVNIPAEGLPAGITCITVTDELTNPVCERLVYVHHPDGAALTVTPDKPMYGPKEKVNLKIRLNSKHVANLSLAAVDAAVPVKNENIVSYLNLQSEVKGNIEHPDRYFDTTNINRFKQLDLLLLTQGWHGFIWKKMADTALTYDHEVEQGMTITGKVRKVWSKGSLAGINITMHAPKAEGQKLFWATTDANGRFTIDNPLFYGYQLLSFTARRSDKIKSDGTAKGNSAGWLQVDSLARDTLPVKPVKALVDTVNSGRLAALELQQLRQSLHLPDSRNLKEVTIHANTSRLITQEAPQVHAITLAEQKEYDNLGQYLAYMIPEASVSWGICAYCSPTGIDGRQLVIKGKLPTPIQIKGVYADKSKIDYCRVCQEDYMGLEMQDVLKVTINRWRDVFGLHASVSIIMRPGVLEAKDYFDNTTADMVGYYKARVFYTPKFGSIDDKPDPRFNTIHWEPNIVTDKNGEATVKLLQYQLKR